MTAAWARPASASGISCAITGATRPVVEAGHERRLNRREIGLRDVEQRHPENRGVASHRLARSISTRPAIADDDDAAARREE